MTLYAYPFKPNPPNSAKKWRKTYVTATLQPLIQIGRALVQLVNASDKRNADRVSAKEMQLNSMAYNVLEKCSVTITVTFGHFSLNGYAKHWENRYVLQFVNQIWPKVTVIVTLYSKAFIFAEGRILLRRASFKLK